MNNVIPKIIHYCWFGGKPLPSLAEKCIKSWKEYFPDYEIKQWNESNFDVNIIPYTSQAYHAKKYAFVSDYARFWILYRYGGLYFDTDVEVIKSMDDIISAGPFMGCENPYQQGARPNELGLGLGVNPGLGLGVNPGLGLYKEILNRYSTLNFINSDNSMNLKTVVEYTTELLVKNGLMNNGDIQHVAGITIYPNDYFCPINPLNLEFVKTERTCCIHHFAASWVKKSKKRRFLEKYLGVQIMRKMDKLRNRLKYGFDR